MYGIYLDVFLSAFLFASNTKICVYFADLVVTVGTANCIKFNVRLVVAEFKRSPV